MEKLSVLAGDAASAAGLLPRPRRRLGGAPPSPADPSPWLKVLPSLSPGSAELDLLMRLARRRRVASGDSALVQGRPAGVLVLLLSGDVVLGSRLPDGRLCTERSVVGPAWLDAWSAWLGLPHEMEAQALSDALVADLAIDDLRGRLHEHPTLGLILCETLARQVHDATLASRNLLRNDAPARLAQWLLQRCPPGVASVVLRLQERKRDIAQQLAMSPETLSRLMRSFEGRGVLSVRGYQIEVHDTAALRRQVDAEYPAE